MVNARIKKINITNQHQTLEFKKLEKEEQTKLKVSRRKGIIKLRAEINEMESRKMIQNINKTGLVL